MNGHEEGEEDQPPKPYDIVTIIGKPENCEAAKKMLLETVPITLEVRNYILVSLCLKFKC